MHIYDEIPFTSIGIIIAAFIVAFIAETLFYEKCKGLIEFVVFMVPFIVIVIHFIIMVLTIK